MIYGHYDVQDPGDPADWTSPAFEPTVRDGRLYARGATDDKGNFLPLLHVACEMARAGELPVHVRVLIEGAEETGSDDVGDWVLRRRARRRRRDRLRQRDGRRRHARADARHARDGLRAHRDPHRLAAGALGHVRRRRAERVPRAAHGAGRGPARARTAACPSRCARGSSRRRRPSSRAGSRSRTARASWRRSARGRPTRAPSRSSTSARRPSRRWTSTGSRAGRRARSSCRSSSADLSVRIVGGQRSEEIAAQPRGAAARRAARTAPS